MVAGPYRDRVIRAARSLQVLRSRVRFRGRPVDYYRCYRRRRPGPGFERSALPAVHVKRRRRFRKQVTLRDAIRVRRSCREEVMKAPARRANSILAIDVGGTHVKVLSTRQREQREIPSGSHMTARKMVRDVKRVTKAWEYGLISIGYLGPVIHGRPLHEPYNLGGG